MWVYRLLQYTLRDVLITEFDPATAEMLFRKGGRQAGLALARHTLPLDVPFPAFAAALQKSLKDNRIGILRLEEADLSTLRFTLAVYEDLDCSGLPASDETICAYDEGFIAGILEAYTGRVFEVREVDCWASGARVCRFEAWPVIPL